MITVLAKKHGKRWRVAVLIEWTKRIAPDAGRAFYVRNGNWTGAIKGDVRTTYYDDEMTQIAEVSEGYKVFELGDIRSNEYNTIIQVAEDVINRGVLWRLALRMSSAFTAWRTRCRRAVNGFVAGWQGTSYTSADADDIPF